ncbi:uncharacterized protein [Solanum lycopersicum]|uniref:uncharacterized protein n=1 Tax=Solanum lycopersicum TaxID=4081 RepID=UPI0037491B1B
MGVSLSEKAELATYQLKDMDQTWYAQWRDNMSFRGGLVTWKIIKATFQDWFFPREMREEKVTEFINLCQGGKSVDEYSLEVIKLSNYTPSLIPDPRYQMSPFVTVVSEDLQEECQFSMLRDNMNISNLMVYARRVEEASPTEKVEMLKEQGHLIEASGDRVSNAKFKKGRGNNSPNEKPTCGKCGKKHYGDCLKGTSNCFSCGKSGYTMRDYPNFMSQDKGSGQAQASGSSNAPKKNHFYPLLSGGEQKTSPEVVTGMLNVFSLDVYALLDSGATFSFFKPLVTKKFGILPDIVHEPFILYTPVGEFVVAKRVYRNCPIMLRNRVSYVDLVELGMLDFDIIFGMDW